MNSSPPSPPRRPSRRASAPASGGPPAAPEQAFAILVEGGLEIAERCLDTWVYGATSALEAGQALARAPSPLTALRIQADALGDSVELATSLGQEVWEVWRRTGETLAGLGPIPGGPSAGRSLDPFWVFIRR